MQKSKFVAMLLCLLFLGGCGSPAQDIERLFASDTVVNIPLNPESTGAPETQAPTLPEQTVPETEETLPEPTEAPSKVSKPTSSGKNTAKATEPPATFPPETEPPEPAVYEISDYVPGSTEAAVVEQINAYRAEAELPMLTMDTRLCAIASVRAYEAGVSWSHTRPDGRDWQTVLDDYGYGCSASAEKLSYGAGYDAVTTVSGWTASDSSGELLSSAYTTVGVGIYDMGGTVLVAAILIG